MQTVLYMLHNFAKLVVATTRISSNLVGLLRLIALPCTQIVHGVWATTASSLARSCSCCCRCCSGSCSGGIGWLLWRVARIPGGCRVRMARCSVARICTACSLGKALQRNEPRCSTSASGRNDEPVVTVQARQWGLQRTQTRAGCDSGPPTHSHLLTVQARPPVPSTVKKQELPCSAPGTGSSRGHGLAAVRSGPCQQPSAPAP